MSTWRLVVKSLTYYWRTNLAVGGGVLVAAAVLTGALLVGDSVRGSLRRLTVERLGKIDAALVSHRFFHAPLAAQLEKSNAFQQHFTAAVPAIVFPSVTVERYSLEHPSRARGVMVVGCNPQFWDQDASGIRPARLPGVDQVVLNQPLADELGVQVGSRVVLRLPKSTQVPADSPLGRKEGRVRSLADLEVVDVIPAQGLGRFDLRASQQLSRNAFLAVETLQDALDQRGKVNAILVAGADADRAPPAAATDTLDNLLQPALEDFGFRIKHVRQTYRPPDADAEQTAFEYFHFISDRMLLEDKVEQAVAQALQSHGAQPVLTYLANSIGIEKAAAEDEQARGHTIPYSTISAIDSPQPLGPLVDERGALVDGLARDEIVLNRWAAEDLQAEPGDRIRVTYFAPETTHGIPQERQAIFTLKAIVPLVDPAEPYRRRRPAVYHQRPAAADDPDLTPEVPGITDQASIDDWDPPFPFHYGRIRGVDEDYWDNFRTTPKAFVSLRAGRRLWGSRFGQTTSFRIAKTDALNKEQIAARIVESLRPHHASLGFGFRSVKRDGLNAAQGTTPFDVLFLGFSFFIIAAALMLVSLLFRLGVEQRADQVGLLRAVGLDRGRTSRLLVLEGLLVSVGASLLGAVAGVGYAWLMLVLMRLLTWWSAVVVTPSLFLYVTPLSLIVGGLAGIVAAAGTIAWTMWQMRGIPLRRLLTGQAQEEPALVRGRPSWSTLLALCLLTAAAGLGLLATQLGGEAQAGAFFVCGGSVLAATLTLLWSRLRTSPRTHGREKSRIGLVGLALRNAARNPGRSTLTIGLMAAACFLIVAISAFRLEPSSAGTGGFELLAESDQPVFADLNSPAGRRELLDDRAEVLESCQVLSLRVKPGDDASCRNLYQARQPRILGVTPAMIAHFDTADLPQEKFTWAASAAQTERQQTNPWHLLDGPATDPSAPVPVVLDKNTAMYGLQLYRGVGEEFELPYDDTSVRFRVAGLLSNSILQGNLLISEANLTGRFPEVSGYRYFLVRTPPVKQRAVTKTLESKLSDQGFDVTETRTLLAGLLAVQNTYLLTFQSLGALGLLLGTFGLATVQLRNVLERRSELALMRAAGFRRRQLAGLVLLENILLLLGGLGVGVFSALFAVLPHMGSGGASVPFATLATMLAVVLGVGVLASLAAVRATVRAPILEALRGE